MVIMLRLKNGIVDEGSCGFSALRSEKMSPCAWVSIHVHVNSEMMDERLHLLHLRENGTQSQTMSTMKWTKGEAANIRLVWRWIGRATSFADHEGHRICKISDDDNVSTLAGSGRKDWGDGAFQDSGSHSGGWGWQ